MREFFIALALCHTAQADETEGTSGFDSTDGPDDGVTTPATVFLYQVRKCNWSTFSV